jgi:hypothetical protein
MCRGKWKLDGPIRVSPAPRKNKAFEVWHGTGSGKEKVASASIFTFV